MRTPVSSFSSVPPPLNDFLRPTNGAPASAFGLPNLSPVESLSPDAVIVLPDESRVLRRQGILPRIITRNTSTFTINPNAVSGPDHWPTGNSLQTYPRTPISITSRSLKPAVSSSVKIIAGFQSINKGVYKYGVRTSENGSKKELVVGSREKGFVEVQILDSFIGLNPIKVIVFTNAEGKQDYFYLSQEQIDNALKTTE